MVVLFIDAMAINSVRWRKEAFLPGRLLGIGLPLTIAFGFLVAWAMFGELSIADAALGQAVISNPRAPLSIRQGLNVESGLNDGIVLPLVMILIAVAEETEGLDPSQSLILKMALDILVAAAVGIAVGWVGAKLLSLAGHKKWMTSGWRRIIILVLAVLSYALADPLGASGFISAWVAGFVVGMVLRNAYPEIQDFAEELGHLLTVLSFFVFGALILGPSLGEITWEVALYAVLSLTLIRMIPVEVSMLRSSLRRPTLLYLGWFGPRGLASIIFATLIVEEARLPGTGLIIVIMAATVGLSVIAHGVTAYWGSNRYADWYEGKVAAGVELRESEEAPEFLTRGRLQLEDRGRKTGLRA